MDDAAGSGEIAIDRDALADDVLDRLEPGTIVDNKVILSRRQLLGVASGGLSAGALATLSATEARAADDSIGQIGEAGGSIDLVVDELKDPQGDLLVDVDDSGSLDWQRASSFPSVDTDDATINSNVTMASEPFEIDVEADANGDLGSALDLIPRIGVANTINPSVTLVLGGGQTYSETQLLLAYPWLNELTFKTEDGAASNATIELSTTSSDGVYVRRTSLRFDGVDVNRADSANPYRTAVWLEKQSSLDFRGGATVLGGTQASIQARESSNVDLVDGVVDNANDGGGGVQSYGNSSLTANANATIQNAEHGVNCDRGGAASIGGTIDDCTTGIRAQDNGVAKLDGGAVTNSTYVFAPEDGGTVKAANTPDYSGTSHLTPYDNEESVEGTFIDEGNPDNNIINGWAVADRGTLTVSAGSTARSTNLGGSEARGTRIRPEWGFNSAPSTDPVEVAAHVVHDSGVVYAEFEERTGNASADIVYTVWQDVK